MEVTVVEAINILKNGGIIIYPTDTAFAIGCRVDNIDSVEKLYALRKRSKTMASPLLCSSISMVKEYTKYIPFEVEELLIKKYWPGALTLVLPAVEKKVPSLLRGGSSTVGVRIPAHETAQHVIREVGIPLVGTSANFHGHQTSYTLSDLDPELVSLVDGVLPGICTVKKESTVLDCTVEPWSVIRQGAVSISL